MPENEKIKVIDLGVHTVSFEESINWVFNKAIKKQPCFVCFANVHMIIEAHKDSLFAGELQKASMVLADGKPVSKVIQWFSGKPQDRIAGMDFLPSFLKFTNEHSPAVSIFFLGSENSILSAIEQRICNEYPAISIAGFYAPPFGVWENEENETIINKIHNSGAQVVFVSLGCPKQEKWMAAHFQKTNTVMLGVGGAFTVFSRKQLRAPKWMQNAGLEWLFRLRQEPGRLMKRYVSTNSLFILLLVKQLVLKAMGFDKQNKHTN
jgi:N-acetylglucosaminyldiphosphoundecaprenol N-acetyl-beta-D-mannosaminyltransferase